jgi:hypothetical protein
VQKYITAGSIEVEIPKGFTGPLFDFAAEAAIVQLC